jgi:hypothetical protein
MSLPTVIGLFTAGNLEGLNDAGTNRIGQMPPMKQELPPKPLTSGTFNEVCADVKSINFFRP